MKKKRHERILDRMNELVQSAINKVSLNAEGALLVQDQGHGKFLVTGSARGNSRATVAEAAFESNVPLIVESGGVSVNIGLLNNLVPVISGVPIYGTGTAESRPLLPLVDSDVYVRIDMTPAAIYNPDPVGPDFVFSIGDLTTTLADVITTIIDVEPSDVNVTFDTDTGAFTAGSYYKWIGRIVSGAVQYGYEYWLTTGLSGQTLLDGLGEPLYFSYVANMEGFGGVFGADVTPSEQVDPP